MTRAKTKPEPERLKLGISWEDAADRLLKTPPKSTPPRATTPRKKSQKKSKP